MWNLSSGVFLLLFLSHHVLSFATIKRYDSTIVAVKSLKHKETHLLPFKKFVPTLPSLTLTATDVLTTPTRTGFDRMKDNLAQLMGYVMGTGAMFIYAPILIKLIQKGNADGFAIATWVYNVLGMSLSAAYPAKKGFPLSTYLELLAALAQSILILGLLCFYQSLLPYFFLGMATLVVSFTWFVKTTLIPVQALGLVQIAASLIANYANVPQILLTFSSKQAQWSGITALMSMAGCLIRVLTTMQLTKDGLVIAGYILGFLTNGILLGQVLYYNGGLK